MSDIEVGKRIAALRKAKGLSVTTLGNAADVGPSAISMIERGERGIRIETLSKIAKALGVSEATLLGQTSTDPEGETFFKNWQGLSPAHQRELSHYMEILKTKQSAESGKDH